MPSDITKYGISGLQGLRGLNQQPTEEELEQQEALQARNKVLKGRVGPSLVDTTTARAYEEGSPMRDWGTSKYDNPFENQPLSAEQMQDTRYENQPWTHTLANGLGKMLGTAGTTFVSSLVGLPYGLAQAGIEGRASALWDNHVTEALSDVNDWLENNLVNYKSTVQENNPWYSPDNLFSMNFIADDIIKNAGFTLGAAASMAVGAGTLGLMGKSLGFVNDVSKGGKMANAALAALFSATGEGMIEAKQGVDEWSKTQNQRLEDELAPEREALDAELQQIQALYALDKSPEGYAVYKQRMNDYTAKKQTFDAKAEAGRKQIEESGQDMGNKILLGNQVLLTAGNMIQFGKAMTKSFDNARHAAEITTKTAKPAGVTAKRVGDSLKEGYKVKGKWPGRLRAGFKGLITEGSEEMNQQFIQSAAGYSEQEEDVNDYWRAKLDPESYRETTRGLYTLGNVLSKGFQDSWGDVNQWEQFVIGGMTGMAGSYSPTKLFNQDKEKSKWNPMRYGSWEGGAYNSVKDFNKDYNQYSENVEALNELLRQEDFDSRTQNLIAHTYLERNKDYAAANDDKKLWKDEDDKQAIHDIQAFLRAGKLDDLRSIYEEMGKDLDNNDIESIVKSTTTENTIEGKTTYSGPFFDDKGNRVKTNDEIREEIKHNSEELNRKLNSYLDSIDYVNRRTNGQLNKDQEDNLSYLHNMGKESITRATKILSGVRQDLPKQFLIKTDKSPEALTRENASSDLAFTKDETTPEGYVKVDTSLMNDDAFADFFIRDMFFGKNFKQSFGDSPEDVAKTVADSIAQREENVKLIQEAFRSKLPASIPESEKIAAEEELSKNVEDAIKLAVQAREYFNTLDEYIANPEKVEEAKKKEEEKIEKANAEDQAKSKFGGKSAKDIKKDLDAGNVSYNDLNAFIKGASSGDIKADEDTVLAAKQAKDINDKQQSLEGFLNNVSDPTAVGDAKQMIQWLGQAAENANDINAEELSQFDAASLISDDEAAYMKAKGYTDEQILEQAETRKQNALNVIYSGIEAFDADAAASDKIPETSKEDVGKFDFGDTGHDSTTKSPSNVGKNDVAPAKPEEKKPEEPATVTQGEAEDALKKAKAENDVQESNNGGTWRSTTRRFGREPGRGNTWHYTNKPYHEIVWNKDSLLYKRSKAIYEFLNSDDVHAFENAENASEDRIKKDMPIRFRAKSLWQEIFGGDDFTKLSQKDQRNSIVIFMVDDRGNVLGDLPLPELERNKKGKEYENLEKFYTKVSDALLSAYAENGTLDAMVEGEDGLNLKFKDGRPITGQVFEVKTGVVPYTNTKKTLNEINKDPQSDTINPFTLAIKVVEGQINTGHKEKTNARAAGKVGQCYILIPDASGTPAAVPFSTPQFNADEMKDTELYRLLIGALSQLEKYADKEIAKEGKNRKERNQAIDTICALLQIENPFLDVDAKDKVIFKYNKLGDKENKQRITIAMTDDWKDRLLDSISGTPIQISLSHINKDIRLEGISKKYNEVIGEIAGTELPEGIRHTVGSWFTIKQITEEGPQNTTRIKYPEGTTVEITLDGGRRVAVTTGNKWSAFDINTGEVIEGDNAVDLQMAKMQAANKDATDGFVMVDINGKTKKYDVKNNKFTEIQPKKPVVKQSSPMENLFGAFNGWNPGTEEGAEGAKPASKKPESKKPVQQAAQKEDKYKTLEDAEKAAKGLGIVTIGTKNAWDILSEQDKIGFMNGRNVDITCNGTTKTISVTNKQGAINTLQAWNNIAKRNPDSLSTVLHRRVDDEKQKKADIQKERAWLQKNLPMFNTEDRLHFLQGLLEIPGEEQWAWGRFEKGIITLSDKAASGTLYHEAFHAVTQTLLSDEELDSLYDAAVKHYKEDDVALVEELLAEDFRKYIQREQTPIIGTILKFFRKLKNAMKNLPGFRDPIQQLFYQINNGKFKESIPRASRRENAFYRKHTKYYKYNDRVNEELLNSGFPIVDQIIRGFRNNRFLLGDEKETGEHWTQFKNIWRKDKIELVGQWREKATGKKGYALNDIIFTALDGSKFKISDYIADVEAMKKSREQYAARQAYDGVKKAQAYDRLTREQIENLEEHQMSKEIWDSMSVKEQGQWLMCH